MESTRKGLLYKGSSSNDNDLPREGGREGGECANCVPSSVSEDTPANRPDSFDAVISDAHFHERWPFNCWLGRNIWLLNRCSIDP